MPDLSDSTILNWIEKNASGFREAAPGAFELTYVTANGGTAMVREQSLRLACRIAMYGERHAQGVKSE
jgi:hypothetical protein